MMPDVPGTATTSELRERVAASQWYHTLELAPGVVTPGWFDLRDVPRRLPLPASLSGARCLDVGTFDGFWAFELERRGAAEVVAIDVLDPTRWDWPAGSTDATLEALDERKRRGEGFEIAREAFGSRVERRELSVYDLDPAAIGAFDFVYMGSLLLHLRDPVLAVERVRSVCRGQALFVEAVDPVLSAVAARRPLATLDAVGRPWWWLPNAAGLRRIVEAGGFRVDGRVRRVRLPAGAGQPRRLPTPRRLASRTVRRALSTAWRGDPHGAVLARPA